MDKLFEYFHKMIRETNIEFHRYILFQDKLE